MASIYFERLYKKYGKDDLHNERYQEMIQEILAHNNEKISNAIGRLSRSNYEKSLKRLSKEKQKTVKLPDLSKVLPKRSVFIIKGAESGKSISNTLRTSLEKDLRDTLKKFKATGKNTMERQRGIATGKINPELINLFQKKITKTFVNYTKKDPKTGVPPNIKNIAVTETRSTINSIKEEYNKQLIKKNPELKMFKVWLHNRSLSKKPRENHVVMNKISVWHDGLFMVKKSDGRGVDFMSRPHDPNAPADQVIGCNCDIIYKAQLPK